MELVLHKYLQNLWYRMLQVINTGANSFRLPCLFQFGRKMRGKMLCTGCGSYCLLIAFSFEVALFMCVKVQHTVQKNVALHLLPWSSKWQGHAAGYLLPSEQLHILILWPANADGNAHKGDVWLFGVALCVKNLQWGRKCTKFAILSYGLWPQTPGNVMVCGPPVSILLCFSIEARISLPSLVRVLQQQ